MTDEELNRRVAEIEGWSLEDSGEWRLQQGPLQELWFAMPPPYATDWAWCGPLIEKYRVSLTQRAICLAVIAAHEGK